MTITSLPADQRGLLRNREFTGYHLFSNGARGTTRPQRFGAVYVFNDDYLFPKASVGMHPHANVEVITVMLAGWESHEDNLDYHQELEKGAVQLISSGAGIRHAGGNLSDQENARHLQIWIAPQLRDSTPSVQLKRAEANPPTNQWIGQISPDGRQGTLTINQDAWLFQGVFDKGAINYQIQEKGHGIMVYVLNGTIQVGAVTAHQEDTLFITEADAIDLLIEEAASLVLLETIV